MYCIILYCILYFPVTLLYPRTTYREILLNFHITGDAAYGDTVELIILGVAYSIDQILSFLYCHVTLQSGGKLRVQKLVGQE